VLSVMDVGVPGRGEFDFDGEIFEVGHHGQASDDFLW
jgi:hypothetical protein